MSRVGCLKPELVKEMNMKFLKKALWGVVLCAAALGVQAQTASGKTIRLVIGYPAGGSIDVVARLMAPRLAEALGQPVIVENKPGANGVLGMDYVAKSAPDGATVFMGTSGNLAMNQSLYPKLPFQMDKDLIPVTQIASLSFVLLVHPSVPYRTVAELVSYAKANPGKVNYASSGNGSAPHLAGELFNMLAGVKMRHIPYKGSTPMIADILGGQVDVTFDTVATSLPHLQSGKLVGIAVTSKDRVKALPDTPAIAETVPNYELLNWFGWMVPTGTPPEAVSRLRNAAVRALANSEIRERLQAMSIDPVGSTPAEFSVFLKAETAKWARVIKEAGVAID